VKVSKQRSIELRNQLLNATAGELCRVGYEALALTSVASACNLATSAIYNRFPTKQALVSALVDERLENDLGRQMDQDQTNWWLADPSMPRFFPDLSVLAELLMATMQTNDLEESVRYFVAHRTATALYARKQADDLDKVRKGQDEFAQVMLRYNFWLGSYAMSLVTPPPTNGLRGVDDLMRMAVMNIDPTTPLTKEPRSVRRKPLDEKEFVHIGLDSLGDRLVDAAAEVFSERSYESASVTEIARRAKLTTGAIYNRFTGKAGLMSEVLLRGAVDAVAASEDLTRRLLAQPRTAAAAIAEFVDGTRPEIAAERHLRLSARDASRREPEVRNALIPLRTRELVCVANVVAEAQSEGSIRPDVDPEGLAWFIMSASAGLPLVGWAFPDLPTHNWIDVFAHFFAAVRTHPK